MLIADLQERVSTKNRTSSNLYKGQENKIFAKVSRLSSISQLNIQPSTKLWKGILESSVWPSVYLSINTVVSRP